MPKGRPRIPKDTTETLKCCPRGAHSWKRNNKQWPFKKFHYTGVDPKQLIGIRCWYRPGHLSWVTCPGSPVLDSLVLGVLVVLGGNKYFTLLCFALLYFTPLWFALLYFTLLYFTLPYCTLLSFVLLYFTLRYFTLLYLTFLYLTVLCFASLSFKAIGFSHKIFLFATANFIVNSAWVLFNVAIYTASTSLLLIRSS